MKIHTPVYRPILKQALNTAWVHRELWPIAAVAGLAGTGTVINDILNQAHLTSVLPSNHFDEVISSWPILAAYRDQFIFISPIHITLGSLALLIAAVAAVITVAACQQVILRAVHASLKKQTHLSLGEIAREFKRPSIFRFLTLDLFLKLIIINIMVAVTFLVANLNVSKILSDAFFGIIFSATTLALALSINILVIFALIAVARKNLSLSQALTYSWQLYRQHPLICLEMSMLLFASNFLISAAYDGTLLALAGPAAAIILGALNTGSFILYLCLVALTCLIIAVLTLAFAGFTTTFTYAAWTGLAERLDKKAILPRTVIHTQRLLQHLR